jgi:hypothetical protein
MDGETAEQARSLMAKGVVGTIPAQRSSFGSPIAPTRKPSHG